MLFSVWPNPGRPLDEVLTLAKMADDDGWYCFWFADHYMENTGDTSFKPGPVHECWTVLPAVAAVTERVRLGPLVAPTSVHHPALLANRAATLDQLSNGRFVLGLGAGWQINEHTAYGIELEAPGRRVSRFEEAIQITASLLANDSTTFHGEFYDFTDAPCEPKPVQSPLPITVGTGSPRMLRITAQHATDWNTWGGPALAAEKYRDFAAACESIGADPAAKHTSVQALIFLDGDPEAVAAGPMGDRSIVGSNEQIIDAFGEYATAGFDEIIIPDFTLGGSAEERRDAYARLRDDVLPNC